MTTDSKTTPQQIDAMSKYLDFAMAEIRRLSDLSNAQGKELQSLRREIPTLRNLFDGLDSDVRILKARSPPDEIACGGPFRLHRGENNRSMEEYATSIGARVVTENGQRCSHCSHVNSRFIRSGGSRLCQVCFAKGVRFE